MARIHYWQYILDDNGNPLGNAQVRVYLSGTVQEANIYLDPDFGSTTTSSSANLTSNSLGFFNFWVGDRYEIKGGYEETTTFKIVWQNSIDGRQEEIDNVYLFSPVRPIDVSDSVKGVPSNKDKDKVISNKQGYKWNLHISQIVPSASPHNIEPVELFDLDDEQNKVISNKLAYQMYQMAYDALTTSIDISASDYYKTTITSWDGPSGGYYHKTITHNLGNKYPIVRVSKVSNDAQILDIDIVESVGENNTTIFWDNNESVNVLFLG